MADREREPSRAFMGNNEAEIKKAIKRLAQEQRYMAVKDITMDDLHLAFMPEKYRAASKLMFKWLELNMIDQELTTNIPAYQGAYLAGNFPLMATFRWDHHKAPDGFLVPRSNVEHPSLQADAPDEVREKIVKALADLGRISWEFGLVNYVFGELNTHGYCNTPQQMRYVWPAIQHIVARSATLDAQFGSKLASASPRAGDKARVPADITEYMVPTNTIIAKTLVIGRIDLDNEVRLPFNLSVNTPTYILNDGKTMMGVD